LLKVNERWESIVCGVFLSVEGMSTD